MTGTGEVDHEETSEEQELLNEQESVSENQESVSDKERGREGEGSDEVELAPNYKPAHISEELAALGYYARSMKPRKGWLSERESLLIFDRTYIDVLFSDIFGPENVLINISETSCLSLIPTSLVQLIWHGSHHLRRIYPKGTRIGSSNFNPLLFWRNGSHVASLNWQVYDRGMQVNEAMFVGSPGWIEKPLNMRKGSEHIPILGREKLVVEVVGVSSCSSFFVFSLIVLTIDVISYTLSASSERSLG